MKISLRIVVGMLLLAVAVQPALAQNADSRYKVVEHWAQFPPEVAKWGGATGEDIDPHGNIFVFHHDPEMPIMAFDSHGKVLRAWGKGMFTTTHFLRADRDGNIWVTDR